MTATTVRHISAKSLILATLAAMGLLAALLVSAQTASAQYPNPQYAGPGNFCITTQGIRAEPTAPLTTRASARFHQPSLRPV